MSLCSVFFAFHYVLCRPSRGKKKMCLLYRKCKAQQQKPDVLQKQVFCDRKSAGSTPRVTVDVEHKLGTLFIPLRAAKVPLIIALRKNYPSDTPIRIICDFQGTFGISL